MQQRYVIIRDAFGRPFKRWALDANKFTVVVAESAESSRSGGAALGFPREDVFEWDETAFERLTVEADARDATWTGPRGFLKRFEV